VDAPYDAIVIGSGVGGLVTAVLLAKHGGQRVLVLERDSVMGGLTRMFRTPDYEFDVGVHYIGRVNDTREDVRRAYDHITEGRLRFHPMPDVYDRIRIASRDYDYPTGTERFRERMKRYFPREGTAIDRYVAAISAVARNLRLYLAEKTLSPLVSRVAGPFMRWPFLRYAEQTTAQFLGGLTEDRELATVLAAQWGDYGVPPAHSSFGMHAAVAHHYLEGAAYPVGGSSQIAASLVPAIERQGGAVLVRAEVAEILTDRGGAVGVRMSDEREFRAGTIVSDAGVRKTFTALLAPQIAVEAGILEKISRVEASTPLLILYAGLKHESSEPAFPANNLWVYPDLNLDANLARFRSDPRSPFPLLFIAFNSAKDPSFSTRHPGHTTVQVITTASYDWFNPLARQGWTNGSESYSGFKQELTERLLAELYRHVPSTRGKVDYAELSTPLSTKDFSDHLKGDIYGLAATPERFRIRECGVRTPVRNLYLTGQDVSVSGVTGAMMGGLLAASVILGRNLVRVVTRRAV
jgi:phytoene dehydrogenase-like protein